MIKLIAIEGLDCVGKSTFVEKFKEHILTNVKDKYKEKVNVITQHFPYYECDTGKELKLILSLSSEENNINRDALKDLFIENMKEWKRLVYDKLAEEDSKNKLTIILADRYTLSTHLYYLPYIEEKIRDSTMDEIIKVQRRDLVNPLMFILLECNPILQLKRLYFKEEKDILFESMDEQKLILKNYYKIAENFFDKNTALNVRVLSHFLDEDYAVRYVTAFGKHNKPVLEKIKEFPFWLLYQYIHPLSKIVFNEPDKSNELMRMIFQLHSFERNMNKYIFTNCDINDINLNFNTGIDEVLFQWVDALNEEDGDENV